MCGNVNVNMKGRQGGRIYVKAIHCLIGTGG